jgi:HlyD family secretion protein
MLRRLSIGSIILLVLGALAWALWPRPVAVETALVSRTDVTITVEEEGKSRIREVFTVSAPISGEVLRVDLHAGEEVVKDKTVVVSIRPPTPELLDARTRRVAEAAADAARAAVDLGAAEVRQSEAQLAFARGEIDRAERLVKQGTISESAFEKAKLAVDTAEAALASAQASFMVRQRELERAEAAISDSARPEDVCCTEVKAPVSGRVLRVLTESEKVVQAGTPLLEIGDPTDLEIVADVLSRDAVQIKPGAEAVIDSWGGPPLPATVDRVDPSAVTKVSALGIEEQRVPVVLQIAGTPEQRARLGDGFRVVVRITVWKGSNLLTIPIGALFREGADWAVYTVQNGRATLRRVTLGARNGIVAEVSSGLSEGEAVVLHPSDQLSDGIRVTAQPIH